MKIPKTFVKENISDKDLERVLNIGETDKVFNRHVDRLLSSCEKFLDSALGTPESKYELGEKVASNYLYTLENLENLSKRIFLENPWEYSESLGIYFSALINKIIKKDETVKLTTSVKLECAGMYLAKGNLIVEGNAGSFAGRSMTGGKIIITGDASDYLAYEMKNGIIVVDGKSGGCIGYQADGGELFVKEVESMIAMSCQATVYKKCVKIWPPDRRATGKEDIT